MTEEMIEKLSDANLKIFEMAEAFKKYREAINSAAKAFEDLASSCEGIISQPYIEVDTREI